MALVEKMNFRSWLDEFRPIELRKSKREVWISFFSLPLSSLMHRPENGFPLSQFLFCSNLILKLDMWPTSRHVSTTRPSSFLSRNNLFHSASSSIYLFYFPLLRFFSKIPFFFGIQQAPDAPKIVKIRLSQN